MFHCETAEELAARRRLLRRAAWSLVAGVALAALTWKAITSPDGVADPTATDAPLSHGAVVLDSGLLVFREGLEAVLVLAARSAGRASTCRPPPACWPSPSCSWS